MKNIEVIVLHESHPKPANMMMFLANLTQSGHKLHDGKSVADFYNESMNKTYKTADRVAAMPHGTINRFAPVTIAIVGASRRFLAQFRTHHIGIEWMSASLQYSDYSGSADFVVPYPIIEAEDAWRKDNPKPTAEQTARSPLAMYKDTCNKSLAAYEHIAKATDNDTAGYVMPQGMRNILVATANREAWLNIIKVRMCKRNTNETDYVTALVWEALLGTADGKMLYGHAGPACMHGGCTEGHLSCGKPFDKDIYSYDNPAREYIKRHWPLLG